MKDKTLTIKARGISPKQWSALILELNIMKKQWKSYGVDIQLSAPSIKKIIALGTTNGFNNSKRRAVSSRRSNKRDDSQHTIVE